MNTIPTFLASGGPLIGFLIFLAVVAINAVLASAKVGQKSQKQPNPQNQPPPYMPNPNMPFKTIGADAAARRARMTSTNPAPSKPPQSLQQVLASAIQDAQNAKRARSQAKASSRPQQRQGKSPSKSKAAQAAVPSPPPLRGPAANIVAAAAPAASIAGGRATIAASQIRDAGSRSSVSPARIDAVAIQRWLRPTTLNQQFILTEVLMPPVALRE